MSTYLSANKLKSDYGIVGDYLIEWRVGSTTGNCVFISGEGTDPLIQMIHPFTNQIVQSGTLYPVIVYSYFNGQKYTLLPNQGGNYSPTLLNCLELYYVSIDNVDCQSGGAGTYSHNYSYIGNLSPAIDASRSIKFDLNSDGTTKFLAWKFEGLNVVDQIIITYYHINDINNPDILRDWKIGSNLSGNDFVSATKKYDYSQIKNIIDLQLYNHESGDYLIIDIIPRTEEPTNNNTNWNFSCKCLETFDDNIYGDDMRVIDTSTVSIVYDTINCVYNVSWKNVLPYTLPSYYRNYIYSRLLTSIEYLGFSLYNPTTKIFNVQLRNKIDTNITSLNYTTVCTALNNSLNITKTGNQIILTFIDNTDYNVYKESYNTIINDATWSNKSSDYNVRSHYNCIRLVERIATNCGDSFTTLNIFIWDKDLIIFDDVLKTITITLSMIVESPTEIDCNDLYDEIVSLKNSIQYSIDIPDFNVNTNVRYNGFIGLIFYSIQNIDSSRSFDFSYYEIDEVLLGVNPTGWKRVNGWSIKDKGYGLDLQTGIVEITNMSDPVNNFRIKTILNSDGTYLTNENAVTVYEVVNGIVITP
jgi:hypothetical protein